MTQVILALLIAISSPLFLLPLEKILPFPYIIEESVKLVIVGIIIKAENETKNNFLIWVILAGILFAISESIFYLVNIFIVGDLMLFPKRLLFTGILHVGTILLFYVFVKKGRLWAVAGFIGAIFIHYLYNSLIVFY